MFPTLAQTNNQYWEQPPGLLIKLTRLNVPCAGGGYIQFNRTITMCGKLEELPLNRRTLYFHSFANTTLNAFNYPKFNFVYKLVDYCYNITLLDRNSSFVIQPTHLALKCHFKIHLSFGNGIAFRLRLDRNAKNSTTEAYTTRQIHMSHSSSDSTSDALRNNAVEYDAFEMSTDVDFDNFLPSADKKISMEPSKKCDGILIEIINRMNDKWIECVTQKDTSNILYNLNSSDNVLLIHITKRRQQEKLHESSTMATQMNDISHERMNDEYKVYPIIHLEYTAIPIESIVSQCTFGWILVGHFCLSTFHEPMTWQQAENHCKGLGGHLASIQNDNDQHMIDEMLLNR